MYLLPLAMNDSPIMEILCYRNLDQLYTKMSDKLLQHGLGRKYQKAIQQYLNYVLDRHHISGHVRTENTVIMYRQFSVTAVKS